MTDTPIVDQCPICNGEAHLIREEREVRYGRRRVRVDDEFMRCSACNEIFYLAGQMEATDARASVRARQERGALLPFEIRAVRERHGLTQAQFERALGVGQKTVVRWESGTVTPNPATNMLLRLIEAEPRNLDLLLEWAELQELVKGSSAPQMGASPTGDAAETTSYSLPVAPVGPVYANFWAEHKKAGKKVAVGNNEPANLQEEAVA